MLLEATESGQEEKRVYLPAGLLRLVEVGRGTTYWRLAASAGEDILMVGGIERSEKIVKWLVSELKWLLVDDEKVQMEVGEMDSYIDKSIDTDPSITNIQD